MSVDAVTAVGVNGGIKKDYTVGSTSSAPKKTKEKAEDKTEVKTSDSNVGAAASVDKLRVSEQAGGANKSNQDDTSKDDNFRQKIEQAITEANKVLKPTNKSFAYSVHEATNEIIIQIKDNETGEVIKEIPSEESLDQMAKIRGLDSGIVFDEKR